MHDTLIVILLKTRDLVLRWKKLGERFGFNFWSLVFSSVDSFGPFFLEIVREIQ